MASLDDPDDATTDDMVQESALQLWAAAQTDFDPFEVPPEEWAEDPVPVRDADIAVDTGLEVEDVREAMARLDGTRLVVGRDGTWSVRSVIPEGGPPWPPRVRRGRARRRAGAPTPR